MMSDEFFYKTNKDQDILKQAMTEFLEFLLEEDTQKTFLVWGSEWDAWKSL